MIKSYRSVSAIVRTTIRARKEKVAYRADAYRDIMKKLRRHMPFADSYAAIDAIKRVMRAEERSMAANPLNGTRLWDNS